MAYITSDHTDLPATQTYSTNDHHPEAGTHLSSPGIWGCIVPLINLLISAPYKLFACILNFPTQLFLTYLLPYLSATSLRINTFHFQTGGRKDD